MSKTRSSRALLLSLLLLTMVGCSSSPKGAKDSEEGDEVAADNSGGEVDDEGLSDEPMGEDAAEDGDDEKASTTAAAPTPAEKPLFERVGGKPALEAFATKFLEAIAANPEIKKNAQISKALGKDQVHHKQMLVEFFCAQSGGPCQYSGRSMKDAHAQLKITKAEWNVMRKVFIRTLRELNVPKPERMALALIAGRQKKQIVVP